MLLLGIHVLFSWFQKNRMEARFLFLKDMTNGQPNPLSWDLQEGGDTQLNIQWRCAEHGYAEMDVKYARGGPRSFERVWLKTIYQVSKRASLLAVDVLPARAPSSLLAHPVNPATASH